MAQKPTRLELHRLKYLKEERKMTLLQQGELDPEEHEQLSAAFFSAVRNNPGVDPYKVYVGIMSEWGIMCHHPQSKRMYEGTERSEFHTDRYKWFFCECCESHVPSRTGERNTGVKVAYGEGDL
jgi:hypothetical protein